MPSSGPSPADLALAAMGGEITPEEFKAKPLPLAEIPLSEGSDRGPRRP